MGLNRVLLYVGVVLFGYMLFKGKVLWAVILMIAALINGVWRLHRYMQDAREREARQWGKIDLDASKRDKH
ncbi:MAG: hypothetical protein JO142_03615 [Burkholderiales bacterium]|nr:hypothetical protein [Burkholderiales bacterium]